MATSPEQLTTRAFTAYFKTHGHTAPAPVKSSGYRQTEDGKGYVVLRDASSVLAVYRVRHRGDRVMLKALKKWPAELERAS